MGSQSDWATMGHAAETLTSLGVPFETRIVSAHRTPDRLVEHARAARGRGIRVIIAGAGGADVGTEGIDWLNREVEFLVSAICKPFRLAGTTWWCPNGPPSPVPHIKGRNRTDSERTQASCVHACEADTLV